MFSGFREEDGLSPFGEGRGALKSESEDRAVPPLASYSFRLLGRIRRLLSGPGQ